jgi:hypothetical protein
MNDDAVPIMGTLADSQGMFASSKIYQGKQ